MVAASVAATAAATGATSGLVLFVAASRRRRRGRGKLFGNEYVVHNVHKRAGSLEVRCHDGSGNAAARLGDDDGVAVVLYIDGEALTRKSLERLTVEEVGRRKRLRDDVQLDELRSRSVVIG